MATLGKSTDTDKQCSASVRFVIEGSKKDINEILEVLIKSIKEEVSLVSYYIDFNTKVTHK